MRMLSRARRAESLAVGSRPALSTADSIARTEVLYRGGQTIARRGSEQRCGTIYAIWRLYRCTLLTGRAYAHPGSMSMAASVLCAASWPTQHTIVSSLADKRGQPKAVAQRLSTRPILLTLRRLQPVDFAIVCIICDACSTGVMTGQSVVRCCSGFVISFAHQSRCVQGDHIGLHSLV